MKQITVLLGIMIIFSSCQKDLINSSQELATISKISHVMFDGIPIGSSMLTIYGKELQTSASGEQVILYKGQETLGEFTTQIVVIDELTSLSQLIKLSTEKLTLEEVSMSIDGEKVTSDGTGNFNLYLHDVHCTSQEQIETNRAVSSIHQLDKLVGKTVTLTMRIKRDVTDSSGSIYSVAKVCQSDCSVNYELGQNNQTLTWFYSEEE